MVKKKQIDSKMVCLGRSNLHCNGKTVGLPVAIAALQILNGKIKLRYSFQLQGGVFANIKRVRRLWRCFKEQSMPYFGYKPD
jgi:hypothetical protein